MKVYGKLLVSMIYAIFFALPWAFNCMILFVVDGTNVFNNSPHKSSLLAQY